MRKLSCMLVLCSMLFSGCTHAHNISQTESTSSSQYMSDEANKATKENAENRENVATEANGANVPKTEISKYEFQTHELYAQRENMY